MSRLRPLMAGAGLLVVSAAFPLSPLQDAATAATVDGVTRSQPLLYLAFAPLFGVWDTLSLLSLSQHYAVLITLMALYLSWRMRAARRGASSTQPERRPRMSLFREGGRALGALVFLLAFYAAGMLLPRPMTGIEVDDPEIVVVDFHSHTNYSHDGWNLFTPSRNRSWHEDGGFNAAYVTDHYTWRGFDEAAASNPRTAGEGTVLLEGAEIRIHRRPTNILGSRQRYSFALDGDSVFMSPDSMAERYTSASGAPPPTLLYTMPGRLARVVPFSRSVPSGMIGIEVNDGSPRGLEQVRAERQEILALADSMDLALIGAANLHGWGRTVASWSLLRIPGWQQMRPTQLGEAIEARLHRDRRRAVTVVERRMPYHDGSVFRFALTLPWVVVAHARMLSVPERMSWIAWLLVLGGGAYLSARTRPGSPAG